MKRRQHAPNAPISKTSARVSTKGSRKRSSPNPDRKPDFGPSELPKAGATVIGARSFLIAFNVYLTTDDVEIAKKIAKAIRHSSGGLRYVKGLGLLVDGRAQVSMNLTDFRKTPLALVVEFIRREAERYGVGIHHSELVGLIPQEALVDAAVWYTQLDAFDKEQILESRLLLPPLQTRLEIAPRSSTNWPPPHRLPVAARLRRFLLRWVRD